MSGVPNSLTQKIIADDSVFQQTQKRVVESARKTADDVQKANKQIVASLDAQLTARRFESVGDKMNADLTRIRQYYSERIQLAQSAAEKEKLIQLRAMDEQAARENNAPNQNWRMAAKAAGFAAAGQLVTDILNPINNNYARRFQMNNFAGPEGYRFSMGNDPQARAINRRNAADEYLNSTTATVITLGLNKAGIALGKLVTNMTGMEDANRRQEMDFERRRGLFQQTVGIGYNANIANQRLNVIGNTVGFDRERATIKAESEQLMRIVSKAVQEARTSAEMQLAMDSSRQVQRQLQLQMQLVDELQSKATQRVGIAERGGMNSFLTASSNFRGSKQAASLVQAMSAFQQVMKGPSDPVEIEQAKANLTNAIRQQKMTAGMDLMTAPAAITSLEGNYQRMQLTALASPQFTPKLMSEAEERGTQLLIDALDRSGTKTDDLHVAITNLTAFFKFHGVGGTTQ